jgi:ATP-dependent RNA helicase RhlE
LYPQSSLGRGRRGGRPAFSSRNRPKPKIKTINPDKFINKAVGTVEEVPFEPVNRFADFGFDQRLEFNVESHGYDKPTPIQDGAIPHVLAGRDLIGLANTGTGKTAAFLLPVMQRMLKRQSGRCLVLVPTRELAIQIEEEFKMFARGLGLYATLVVGGASINRQLDQLRRRPQFIVATPGRLKDLLQNYGVHVDDFDVLVLDEADRMLDMGFIRDIRAIMSHVRQERQTLFLSATITPEIESLIQTLLKDPATVSVRTRETSDHVEQDVVRVEGGRDAKEDKLVELLQDPDFKKVLIFGETKWGVQRLADRLKQYEDYVHRIGRTGRAGQMGKALTFVPR